MKLHELFAQQMKAGGIRKSDIARGTGVSWSAAHQWIIGETVPDTQNMAELQDILGIRNLRYSDDRDVITYELTTPRHRRAGDSGHTPTNVAPTETPFKPEVTVTDARRLDVAEMPKDIEERGVAVGGANADFAFNGTVVDYVRRPPGLAKAQGIFAVRVVAESMAPRYFPGDLVYVSTLRAPVLDDFVILELYPEKEDGEAPAFIKQLVARGPKFIVCRQFNPPGEVRFATDRVRSLYRIIPTNELFGV